jgi:hypothetical protein
VSATEASVVPLDTAGPLSQAPIWLVAIVLLGAMFAAAFLGRRMRSRDEKRLREASEGQEGFILSAVLGLLALLLGFTFALAVDRFESRRLLVVDEANAIGTTYLRVQLLDEPHRARLTRAMSDYVDNRIVLAKARRRDVPPLLATNDRLVTELWAGTMAAFPTIKDYDFSSTFVDGMNEVIDLDATRKSARLVRVPGEVYAVLMTYHVVAAWVLGYVLIGSHGRTSGAVLVFLFALSLLLIVDIDRPTLGLIREGQGPMLRLQQSLDSWRPEILDRLSEDPAS